MPRNPNFFLPGFDNLPTGFCDLKRTPAPSKKSTSMPKVDRNAPEEVRHLLNARESIDKTHALLEKAQRLLKQLKRYDSNDLIFANRLKTDVKKAAADAKNLIQRQIQKGMPSELLEETATIEERVTQTIEKADAAHQFFLDGRHNAKMITQQQAAAAATSKPRAPKP